jgi:hypothetical protein
MYYSVTNAIAPLVSKDLVRMEQYATYMQRGSDYGRYSHRQQLEDDMDRVSKYPGKTVLGMLFGYYRVFLRRTTEMKIDNSVFPIYHEIMDYEMTVGQWDRMGTTRLGHIRPLWWTQLEALRFAKTDRAYHSVLHATAAIGEEHEYKRFIRWKSPPIDPSFLQDIWSNELGDSEEDKRCMICLDDFTFKGDARAVRLPCNHVFCRECIKKWVETSNPPKPCPACRTALPPPPAQKVIPPPTFNSFDRPITINCGILMSWYREFKQKEAASTYAERRFNPIFSSEVAVIEALFNEKFPPDEGSIVYPRQFSHTLQNAVEYRLADLLKLEMFQPIQDYLFPGFDKLVVRICDGMAFRLRDEADAAAAAADEEL